jgi:2-methylcitrate dehydratase PrpD
LWDDDLIELSTMPVAETTSTALLAEFTRSIGTVEVPELARRRAQSAILDTLGVALVGLDDPAAIAARRYLEPSGTEGRTAAVWGTALRAGAAAAAWANGIAAHAQDYNAFDNRAFGDASAVLAPVVLALGERDGASGSRVVDAFVAGHEVATAVGAAVGEVQYDKGHHTSGTINTLSATVAAAVLLRLGPEQIAHAIGIASSVMPTCLQVNYGTDTKPLHVGEAAGAGIRAASLAALGFTGSTNSLDASPYGYLDTIGGDLERLHEQFRTLGSRWRLEEAPPTVKLFPSMAGTHASIAAALALRERVDVARIDEIVVWISANTVRSARHHDPATGLEGKFCLEYCVATALLEGTADLDQFTDEGVTRPHIRELMRQVRLEYYEPYDDYVTRRIGWPGRVEIRLSDGSVVSEEVLTPLGTPGNPASAEVIAEKFRRCAGTMLDDDRVGAIVSICATLAEQSDVSALTSLLGPEAT